MLVNDIGFLIGVSANSRASESTAHGWWARRLISMDSNVGTSRRTVMKHALLNKIVGREVGSLSTRKVNCRLYQLIDLCAGHGEGEQTSPQIMNRHAEWLQDRGVRVRLSMFEKDDPTFRRLTKSMRHAVHVNMIHGDAATYNELIEPVVDNECDYCFVLNDPNTVVQFAITPDLLQSCPVLTTTLSTLGCNPAGVKRLPFSGHRDKWFAHITNVVSWLPSHHDAWLVRLNRDEAQWAYLITGPAVWHSRYVEDANRAFSTWDKGIDIARWRTDGERFAQVCKELFLQKSEMP